MDATEIGFMFQILTADPDEPGDEAVPDFVGAADGLEQEAEGAQLQQPEQQQQQQPPGGEQQEQQPGGDAQQAADELLIGAAEQHSLDEWPTAEEAAALMAAAGDAGDGVQEAGVADAETEPAAGAAAAAEPADQQTASETAAASSARSAAAAGGSTAAAGAAPSAPGGGEDDELAANLLSNMASWQSELDTFQAALRRCMQSTSQPNVPPLPPPSADSPSLDAAGRPPSRPGHSGPKGITGYRGVTQHKRTRRFEANVWMEHKQMYLGAFDAPEQAAHAHDIGALCSGKARTETLNFPMSDYEDLMPMLYTLPHAQVVAALRSYGRLPTARPSGGGISSGRLMGSPSVRTVSVKSEGAAGSEGAEDSLGLARDRPRRARKHTSASPSEPMDWQTALQLPAGVAQQQQGALVPAAGSAAIHGLLGAADGPKQEPHSPAALAAAQQAQLQALSAALMGSGALPGAGSNAPLAPLGSAADASRVGAATGALLSSLGRLPSPPVADNSAAIGTFESALCVLMARAHLLQRPMEIPPEGGPPRPLHSGPKGQSGYKGVTLYKRCQRYNAHIWLGKQTHIGTFHTAEQAAAAHDIMEVWRNPEAQGLNFDSLSYEDLVPLLAALSEADALASLRNYSRSPSAVDAAAAAGITVMPMPSKSARPFKKSSKHTGSSSQAAAAATVAAAAAAAPAPLPPSLRRRSRKPQHVAGGGSGAGTAEPEDSSGGSVLPQRTSAGNRMWLMLEQEKSADSDLDSQEFSDPDFSPEEAAAMQQASGGKRARGSESPEPLAFHPRSCSSVANALASPLPSDRAVVGARPPRPGSSHRWGVAVSLRGQAAWFGRLDKQRAAVAADLSLLWRRVMASASGEPEGKDSGTPYNVPSAGYDRDPSLMEQMKRIKTAPQLCQFLAAVIPQDPPAPSGGAAAAAAANAAMINAQLMAAHKHSPVPAPAAALAASAAASAGALPGAHKRKQQTLLEEARAGKLQALQAGSDAGAAAPRVAAAPGGAVAAVASSRLGRVASTAASEAATNGVQEQQQQELRPQAGALAAAAAAVEQADTSDSGSMLAALRKLEAAGTGGALLQEVVAGWGGYPLMQQQDLFGALRLPVAGGDWDQLEERLQVAFDLGSLF